MLVVEHLAAKINTNELLRDTIVSSLGFAAALSLREFLVAVAAFVSPSDGQHATEKLLFLLFLAVFLFLITIISVILWT
jgi:hypothetical protein